MALSSARLPAGAEYQSSAASTALRGLADDVSDLQRRLCGEQGLEPREFAVLRAMAEMPEGTREELAIAAGASKVGLASAEDSLAAAKLIYLTKKGRPTSKTVGHPQGVAQRLRVSDVGRVVLADIHGGTETALEAVLGLLEPGERDRMARILEHCRTAVWGYGVAPVVAVLEPAE